MTTRAVEEVDQWDSRPLRGGYRGLRDLAADEFSGIVRSGRAKLCMLNGTVVGILDGDIGDFEEAEGTAYEAPSPALPLLALMQDRSEEVRAKYYTEDTPISTVDDTLTDGGFTGYIELSENVLSGDYYVVYHEGRSMAVAFVGNSGQLLTGDEAFERADGEVGIYEVRPADVDNVEIPGGSTTPGSTTGRTTGPETDAGSTTGPATGTGSATGSETDAGSAGGTARTADTGSTTASDPSSRTERTDTQAEPTADAGAGGSTDATGDERTATGASSGVDSAEGHTESTSSDTDRDRASGTTGDDGPAVEGSGSAADPGYTDDRATETGRVDRADADAGTSRRGTDADTSRRETGAGARAGEPDDATAGSGSPGSSSGSGGPEAGPASGAGDERESESRSAGSGGAAGPSDVETRSIPSLDPDRTSTGADEGADGDATVAGGAASTDPDDRRAEEPDPDAGRGTPGSGGTGSEGVQSGASTAPSAGGQSPSDAGGSGGASDAGEDSHAAGSTAGSGGAEVESSDRSESSARGRREAVGSGSESGAPGGSGTSGDRVSDLETRLEEREAEIDRLESDLGSAEAEAEDLRATLADVRAERDELRSRVEDLEADRERLGAERDDLEAEVARLEEELEGLQAEVRTLEDRHGAAGGGRDLGPLEALDRTNLFVRYNSKGKATLESAHGGNASRREVGENLELEYHTQFDAESVSIAGRPFDQFLRGTIQYRFVSWLIHDLLYEIRDTGKSAALQDLYDAIPRIDRAELDGTISAEHTQDGQDRRTEESFDVVVRDRMGNPLVVANINDSREATTETMMSTLVTASSHVGESTDSLAASFFVTSSFFDPEALETAASATSGGLLSRDKRESFVKLSRKRGYHLCLVEAREDNFHLAVPEL